MRIAIFAILSLVAGTFGKPSVIEELQSQSVDDVLGKVDIHTYCRNRVDGNYPSPSDHRVFIACSNGIAHLIRCPKYLCFDTKSEECTWCSDKDFCANRKDGSYANTEDRYTYFKCAGGIKYTLKCPIGLCYNKERKKCSFCFTVGDEPSTGTPRPTPPKGFCHDKKDGNYPNPNDKHSFIACSGGIGYVMDCPEKLCYDHSVNRCERCSSGPATPVPTHNPTVYTTNKPRPTPPKGFCHDKKDGNYPNPNDKHSFIACSGGIGYVMDCPEKLCYDHSVNRCERCSSGPATPVPTHNPTVYTTGKPRPTPPKGFCHEKKDGNYENPSDKHSFISCSGGLGYVMDCPHKLCYSAKTDRCENCADIVKRGGGFCVGKANQNYANPNNVHSFIVCSNGIAYIQLCPANLCFDKSLNRCEYCLMSTSLPLTTSKHTVRPIPPKGYCDNRKDGNYPNPSNRHGFISCSGGIGYLMDCPENLCYSVDADRCEWCSPHPTNPQPTQNPTYKPDGFCDNKKDGNYPNPKDVHSFISCSGSIGYVMACPEQLCYDQAVDRCDHCSSRPTTSMPMSKSTGKPRPTPPKGFCNDKKDGNYENVNDKHSFITCANGHGYVMDCPHKLCYSGKTDRCENCADIVKRAAPCVGRMDGNYKNPTNIHTYIRCSHGVTYVVFCPEKLCFEEVTDNCSLCPPLSTNRPPTSHGGFCFGKGDGNYVNPTDRNSFISCSNGIAYVVLCPANLCFDQSKDRCEFCATSQPMAPTSSPHSVRPTPPNGFCDNRKDGNYPSQNDKHSFISCSGGRGYVMDCPAKLCYDHSVDRCEWCSSRPGTPQPTSRTTSKPRPTPPKGFCDNNKDGNYPNPNDKHSFISCSGGRGYVMDCPAKLCYDHSVDRCEWCSSRPGTPQPTSRTTSKPRPTPPKGFCYGKKNGNYENPNERHSFISCSNGLSYVMDCPHKLCYSGKTDRCENCADIAKRAVDACQGRQDGNFVNPSDRHSFITCSNGKSYVRKCPSKLCYDGKKNRCDYCSSSPVTTQQPATTSVRPTAPEGFCHGKKNGNYRNPSDKHSFISCSNGFGFILDCPHRLCYNAKTDQCDHCAARTKREDLCAGKKDGNYANPKDKHSYIACTAGVSAIMKCPHQLCFVAKDNNCDWCRTTRPHTTVKPTTRSAVSARPTPPKGFCHGKKDGNYADPKDKHSFIMCTNGRGFVMACPASLCFDVKKDRCESCQPSSESPVPTTSMRPSARPTPPNGFCLKRKNGNYENPTSKHSFISCSNNIGYVFKCPENLCYVVSENKCLTCSSLEPREAPNDPSVPGISCVGKAKGTYKDPTSCSKFVVCDGKGKGREKVCPHGLNFQPYFKLCVHQRFYSCTNPDFCTGRKNGKYFNDNNCYGYYWCVNGLTYVMNCSPGKKFNGNSCVPANEYICNLV